MFESFLNREHGDLVYVGIMLFLLYITRVVLLLRSIKFAKSKYPASNFQTSELETHVDISYTLVSEMDI